MNGRVRKEDFAKLQITRFYHICKVNDPLIPEIIFIILYLRLNAANKTIFYCSRQSDVTIVYFALCNF